MNVVVSHSVSLEVASQEVCKESQSKTSQSHPQNLTVV